MKIYFMRMQCIILKQKYDKEVIYFSLWKIRRLLNSQSIIKWKPWDIKHNKLIASDSKIYDYIKDENSIRRYKV